MITTEGVLSFDTFLYYVKFMYCIKHNGKELPSRSPETMRHKKIRSSKTLNYQRMPRNAMDTGKDTLMLECSF